MFQSDVCNPDVVITKVTTGQAEKTAPLAQLTDEHFELVHSPDGWLDYNIVHQVHVYICEINPSIRGFQRPTLGPCKNFDVVTGEFIQILHTGNYHWVCVSSIGCLPGIINLYDNLYHNVFKDEIEEQVKDLVAEDDFRGITVVPVQQRPNRSYCCISSAAFATCLAHYQPPEAMQLYFNKMWEHLLEQFSTR